MMKLMHEAETNAMAKVMTFCRVGFAVDKILLVRNNIESRVQVAAAAKRVWLARESFKPTDTISYGTSHACRSHPKRDSARRVMITKAVVGSYSIMSEILSVGTA
jgi:hypothetical protein